MYYKNKRTTQLKWVTMLAVSVISKLGEKKEGGFFQKMLMQKEREGQFYLTVF